MNWLRSVTAASLALAIFAGSSMIALAGTEAKALMGEISVSGDSQNASVLLNGEAVSTGRTFFSNGTITTPEAVTSTVKLGKLGYVALAPNTTLTLNFDEKNISGTLSAGQAKVFNAEGVNVNIANLNEAAVAPVNKAQDDSDDDGFFGGSAVGPVLVFGGIVAAAVILVVANDDDDEGVVSAVR